MDTEGDDDLIDTDKPQDVPIRVADPAPRGIRNIAPSRQPRPRADGEFCETPPMPGMPGITGRPPRPRAPGSRRWMWIAAILAIIVVAGLALIAFRKTSVTVTPRSHTIVLTDATQFTAYPASSSATGTLTYTLQTSDLDDSEVVAVTGTTSIPAAKASGSITVYNNYSTAPVRLVKTTRFQTPDGLVFRVPADVTVPGKTGSTPGKVQVTVIADQDGSQYNVGPVSRFTLPGLKSNADMYANVYASSAASMAGGASASNGPGVDPGTLASTIAKLQASLQAKAQAAAAAQSASGGMVLPGLTQITFTQGANTPEAGGSVRIHETAHVQVPVFDAAAFATAVGSAVSADTGAESITLVPGSGFSAQIAGTPTLGTDPLPLTLTGQAQLIWNIDTAALAQALAGRDQSAFQTIIGGFPGIAEARARVEPFWRSTFPTNPKDINIIVTAPTAIH
jgi:hypothetical protein